MPVYATNCFIFFKEIESTRRVQNNVSKKRLAYHLMFLYSLLKFKRQEAYHRTRANPGAYCPSETVCIPIILSNAATC